MEPSLPIEVVIGVEELCDVESSMGLFNEVEAVVGMLSTVTGVESVTEELWEVERVTWGEEANNKELEETVGEVEGRETWEEEVNNKEVEEAVGRMEGIETWEEKEDSNKDVEVTVWEIEGTETWEDEVNKEREEGVREMETTETWEDEVNKEREEGVMEVETTEKEIGKVEESWIVEEEVERNGVDDSTTVVNEVVLTAEEGGSEVGMAREEEGKENVDDCVIDTVPCMECVELSVTSSVEKREVSSISVREKVSDKVDI